MKAKKLCQSLYNMSTEYRNNKLIQDKLKIVKNARFSGLQFCTINIMSDQTRYTKLTTLSKLS